MNESGSLRVRDSSDWINTISWLTPLFVAMHFATSRLFTALVRPQNANHKKASAHWFASHVVSTAHAIVVTTVSLQILLTLSDAPSAIKLGTRAPQLSVANDRWLQTYPRVAAVGELFTAWLFYDLLLVVGVWSILGSWETIVHHLGFLCAAGVLRGFYFAPWQSAVCLCMEASTPFLNVCQLKEALGLDKSSPVVVGAFGGFALNFFVFRIIVLAAGLVQLLLGWESGPWKEPPLRSIPGSSGEPPAVPAWVANALVALLVAALSLMLMWFRRILLILMPGSAVSHGAQHVPSGDELDTEASSPRTTTRKRELSDDEELALVTI